MFDLALFRKPTFTGASIVAFALSASMFAMFLYITLYMQNVLGYSPLETGLRFLPLSLLSFFVGADRRPAVRARAGARASWRGGLLLVGGRPAADARHRGRLGVDDAAGRLHRRRRRHRPGQPAARLDRDRRRRRRSAAAWRRASTRRSARSASPPASPALGAIFQARVESKLVDIAPRHAGQPRRPSRSADGDRLRRLQAGDRAGAARARGQIADAAQPGVHRGLQRHPAGRRGDRGRRRDRRRWCWSGRRDFVAQGAPQAEGAPAAA